MKVLPEQEDHPPAKKPTYISDSKARRLVFVTAVLALCLLVALGVIKKDMARLRVRLAHAEADAEATTAALSGTIEEMARLRARIADAEAHSEAANAAWLASRNQLYPAGVATRTNASTAVKAYGWGLRVSLPPSPSDLASCYINSKTNNSKPLVFVAGQRTGHGKVGLGNILLFLTGAAMYSDTHTVVLAETHQVLYGTSDMFGSNFSNQPYTETIFREIPRMRPECVLYSTPATCDMPFGGFGYKHGFPRNRNRTACDVNVSTESVRATWPNPNGLDYHELVRRDRPPGDFHVVGMCGSWPTCMRGVAWVKSRLHLEPLTAAEKAKFAGIENGTCLTLRLRRDWNVNTSSLAAFYRVVLGHLGAEAGRLFFLSDVPDAWKQLGIDRTATRIEGSDVNQLRAATYCKRFAIATSSTFYLWVTLLMQRRNSIFLEENLHWRTIDPKEPAIFGNRRVFTCNKNKCTLLHN